MFGKINRALGAIRDELEALSEAITVASERPHEPPPYGDMPERLSSLEGRLAIALGEIDAGLLKAESIKSAARSAEERARTHMKRGEAALEAVRSLEDGEEEGSFESTARAYQNVIDSGNGGLGGAQEVQPMPQGLEISRQGVSFARAAKRR